METGICKMNPRVQRFGGRHIRRRSEEREEFLGDVNAQRADGEDVAAEVELAVLDGGKQERGMDVGLEDEVADLGHHDAVSRVGALVAVVRVGSVGFPSLEDGAEFLLAAEQPDALPSIAHAWFKDPPFPILRGKDGVAREALMQLVSFEEGVVEELSVVELEVQGRLDVVSQRAGRVFGEPRGDGVCEVVFPDQRFAD